jgi:hypothetical protein
MSEPNPIPPMGGGTDVNQQIEAANQQALNGTGSSSSSTDLYGLGQWKNQPIDPSGFPPAVALLLQQAGIDTSKSLTGAQLAQVHNPGLVAQIQQMLFYAGAYGSSVQSLGDLQIGVFGSKDIKALGDTITSAGQTGTPFGTYLTTSANYGKANGILNTITGASQNPVGQASRADTDPVLRSMAQSLFGHDPSPNEYARFQAFYNQKVLGEAQDKANAATQETSNLPDTYTLGKAIGDKAFLAPTTGGVLQPGQQRLLARAGDASAGGATAPTFQSQIAQDQQTLGAVDSAASSIDNGGFATQPLIPAGSAQGLQNAAEDFLRQNDAADIAQQNVATKYRTLLSILGGAG